MLIAADQFILLVIKDVICTLYPCVFLYMYHQLLFVIEGIEINIRLII